MSDHHGRELRIAEQLHEVAKTVMKEALTLPAMNTHRCGLLRRVDT